MKELEGENLQLQENIRQFHNTTPASNQIVEDKTIEVATNVPTDIQPNISTDIPSVIPNAQTIPAPPPLPPTIHINALSPIPFTKWNVVLPLTEGLGTIERPEIDLGDTNAIVHGTGTEVLICLWKGGASRYVDGLKESTLALEYAVDNGMTDKNDRGDSVAHVGCWRQR